MSLILVLRLKHRLPQQTLLLLQCVLHLLGQLQLRDGEAGSDPADDDVADAETEVDDAHDTDEDEPDEESVAVPPIALAAGRFSSFASMEMLPPAGATPVGCAASGAAPSSCSALVVDVVVDEEPLLIFKIILGESVPSGIPAAALFVGEWPVLLASGRWRSTGLLAASSCGFGIGFRVTLGVDKISVSWPRGLASVLIVTFGITIGLCESSHEGGVESPSSDISSERSVACTVSGISSAFVWGGGGRIGLMLSLVTTVAPPAAADEVGDPASAVLAECPAGLVSCCCCWCGAEEGTLIVILSAVDGEVVTATDVGADEHDEMGDDSRELILVSLELLLSSPDCFAGGRIGLIVSFGTVGGNSAVPALLLPSAEQFWVVSFGGIGLIVSFGIELELINSETAGAPPAPTEWCCSCSPEQPTTEGSSLGEKLLLVEDTIETSLVSATVPRPVVLIVSFGSFGGSGSGLMVTLTPSKLVSTGEDPRVADVLQFAPADRELLIAVVVPSCWFVFMCNFGIGPPGTPASTPSVASFTRKLL
uniref:Uncharacterized protein n=1 Tax=Anopheles melas TaxID=34690 RepID=A0A182U7H6_9DIPT